MTLWTLAILVAIVTVGFALWADYRSRGIDLRKKEDTEYNPENEASQVRLAGFAAAMVQLFLFLSAGDVRFAHPLAASLLFGAAVLVQAVIQAALERKLQKPVTSPMQQARSGAVALLWITFSALLYSAIVVLSVAAFAWLARWTGVEKSVAAALVFFGAIAGLVGGLALNFALAPFHVRRSLPVSPMPADLAARCAESFAVAGLRPPSFWIIEPAGQRVATAFITGFSNGRGIFRPGLFVTRSLVEVFTPDELRAVLFHEMAHIRMGHLSRRLAYSSLLVLLTMGLGIFVLTVLPALAPVLQEPAVRGIIGPVVALGAFILAFRMLALQSKRHEFEADFYAVFKLGVTLPTYVGALRKLDVLNSQDSGREGSTHPATDRRIALLEMLATRARPNAAEKKAA